ncbi:MAG: hypothetical protein C0598_05155 [Marinilabiliales bacterium]|nr:MAG: hypothetical protein C0598_05155 [Marinilabiliales bacterium]
MTFFYIILTVLAIIIILFFVAVNNFKNPHVSNEKNPLSVGIEFEINKIPSLNSKKLNSWWISNENSNTSIILMHGWGKNAARLLPYIKNLNFYKYNILAFDSRNHGDSDKDKYSSMIKFSEDISSCIDFLKKEKKESAENIYLIGLSIGGAASIYAAANDDRINKIVTVGAPSNPADVMKLHLLKKKIPNFIISMVFKYLEIKVGKKFDEICAANNINRTRAKTLLVHGTLDRVVPVEQGELIYSKADKHNVDLWNIDGKGHSNCHYEKGYWKKLLDFFNEQ